MPQNTFQTNARSITLNEAPWNVTTFTEIYVKLENGELSCYLDAACAGDAVVPLQLDVYRKESTGLYFYLVHSPATAEFADPPVSWEGGAGCPGTVRYGKIDDKRLGFSMSDYYDHGSEQEFGFDIVVDPGNGAPPISTGIFKEIDPTIMEKGEDPPPDARR